VGAQIHPTGTGASAASEGAQRVGAVEVQLEGRHRYLRQHVDRVILRVWSSLVWRCRQMHWATRSYHQVAEAVN